MIFSLKGLIIDLTYFTISIPGRDAAVQSLAGGK
jgi:hypothetical protein